MNYISNQEKKKIFVLADDLTGASEIGGIALQFGLTVKILFSTSKMSDHNEDVIIIDSNSRNLKPKKAYQRIIELTSNINFSNFDLFYKKTDSVLRGCISTELEAFTKILNYQSTLLVPANPSKKRIIKAGQYYIDKTPLSHTGFRFDPHFPRYSNYVKEIIIDSNDNIYSTDEKDQWCVNKIIIPDVSSTNEIQSIVAKLPEDKILPGGGADFFREILSKKMNLVENESINQSNISPGATFVVGSNSVSSRKTIRRLAKLGYAVFRLPVAAIDQPAKFDKWLGEILETLENERPIVISGPIKRLEDPIKINKIGKRLVEVAKLIAQKTLVKNIMLMEGGETASNFFREMGWETLVVCGVYGPGIVALKHHIGEMKVVIKPGSYPWPDTSFEHTEYSIK
jgi:D-threonate/D-erythronate kinase